MSNINAEKMLSQYKNSFSQYGYAISFEDGLFWIRGNDLNIAGKAANTLWTGEGVLCRKDYDFFYGRDVVMVDIGLNIGITSLFMAKNPNIAEIYAYEPFLPTFRQAQENFARNPDLARKIRAFDFGLGGKEESFARNYNEDLPGSMSSVCERFASNDTEQKEKILIKKSSDILTEISETCSLPIFLKIDCEGAEKEIIADLHVSGLLKKVCIIIMEWHFSLPDDMINLLKKDGFVVFNEVTVPGELGMIRAVRVE